MGANTTATKNKDERNPMNMTTSVRKQPFGIGDRWQNVLGKQVYTMLWT